MNLFFVQAELKKKYSEEQLPAAYANLESILKSNKGGDGFLVGDAVRKQNIKPFFGWKSRLFLMGI